MGAAFSAKRIFYSHPLDSLAVAEIFGKDFGALRGRGACNDEPIPEGNPVQNGAIDTFFDDLGSDLNNVKTPELSEVLAGLERGDSKFSCGGRKELLKNLCGDHSGPLLRVPGYQPKRHLLLSRVGLIHRIDQNIRIEETSPGHDSVAVEFFPGKFGTLRVA